MEFKDLFKKSMDEPVSYGTAGYRTKHMVIKDIARRAYLFCLVRSSALGKPIGLVLTASHNPSPDNGIKYIDHTGNMICEEDEALSDKIVNGPIELVESIYQSHKNARSTVLICRDTRSSGEGMVEHCKDVSEYLGSGHTLLDMGILSTPQAHFLIRDMFCNGISNEKCTLELLQKSIEKYYQRIENMCKVAKRIFSEEPKQKRVLDSSNGVARHSFERIQKSVSSIVEMRLLKNSKDLNEECGSDYIKSTRKLPAGVSVQKDGASEKPSVSISTEGGEVCEDTLICAFDGDADRILYLKPSTNQLIDGDRLCVLFAAFLNHLLLISGIDEKITTVVTEYTNGAATKELKTKGSIKVAGTGVKNMQKASNNDVTAWFESNGHGTVCFSEKTCAAVKEKLGYSLAECILDLQPEKLAEEMDALLSRPSDSLSYKEIGKSSPYNGLFRRLTTQEALLLLHSMNAAFDPYIGDALVNMLVCECIFYSGFILPDVLLGIYQDLPNILTSVEGKRDRLNELLVESIKNKHSSIRVHLRASGTEDIIRIYVEGESMDELKDAVEDIKTSISEL
ncbi:phosphoacetylglucosamine mutase [Nematocida major]|uniref:phosphoacetylglucosamine mutase n=1 Tax=Nematocida major TaxID=1912982 RepID=UPI002008EA65|nr:phosphoacetylglucosamine mutase [Nematocida major]KAH9385216.1 phosphoacetylglucosamine mutase [Nematocida major]